MEAKSRQGFERGECQNSIPSNVRSLCLTGSSTPDVPRKGNFNMMYETIDSAAASLFLNQEE